MRKKQLQALQACFPHATASQARTVRETPTTVFALFLL